MDNIQLFMCDSYDKIGISTLFWHRVKEYFMCIKTPWLLFTLLNINKIHWFISNILLQTYKIDEIMDINATFWHRAMVYILPDDSTKYE